MAPKASKASKKEIVSYDEYVKVLDYCSADVFGRYASRFSTVYYTFTLTHILCLALAGISQGPTVFASDSDLSARTVRDLSTVALIASFVGTVITSILHVSKVQIASLQCSNARTDILYYLSTKKSMSRKTFETLLHTNTLCFEAPDKCTKRQRNKIKRDHDDIETTFRA